MELSKREIMDLTKEEIIEALNNSSSKQEAAEKLNVSLRTIYRKINKFNIDGNKESEITEKVIEEIEKETTINERLVEQRLKEKNSQLEKLNKQLLKEISNKSEEIEKILDIKNSIDYRGEYKGDFAFDLKKSDSDENIATLFFSDEHFGEVVNPAQVNGINEYNTPIAIKRYNNVIVNSLDVIFNHLNNVNKKKLVINLGGDNISGDIHDELSVTNDMTTMESVYVYVEEKERGIKTLLNAGFEQILINCVRGNHDRNTDRVHTKNILETSSAYLVYKFLQKIFAGDKRVVFNIATGQDCLYQLNNHRMLLTHGDCFKGGNGIGGITIPILRGFLKKQSNYAAVGNHIDSMCIGHFHQYTSINGGQVIINGSLKGFDEYSQRMGFGYQEPCQAFFLTNPRHGITIQLPIFAEKKEEKKIVFDDWSSWKKGLE